MKNASSLVKKNIILISLLGLISVACFGMSEKPFRYCNGQSVSNRSGNWIVTLHYFTQNGMEDVTLNCGQQYPNLVSINGVPSINGMSIEEYMAQSKSQQPKDLGDIISKEYELPAFSDIEINLIGTYQIRSIPDSYKVLVETNDGIQKYVKMNVQDGKLTISLASGVSVPKDIKIVIDAPLINKIKVIRSTRVECSKLQFADDAGIDLGSDAYMIINDVNCKGKLSFVLYNGATLELNNYLNNYNVIKNLKTTLSNGSILRINNIDIEMLNAKLYNDSQMLIKSVKTPIQEQKIKLSNNSIYDARSINSKKAIIKIYNGSKAYLGTVSDEISCDGNCVGNIQYSGSPSSGGSSSSSSSSVEHDFAQHNQGDPVQLSNGHKRYYNTYGGYIEYDANGNVCVLVGMSF